jgi:hypothetical protein
MGAAPVKRLRDTAVGMCMDAPTTKRPLLERTSDKSSRLVS